MAIPDPADHKHALRRSLRALPPPDAALVAAVQHHLAGWLAASPNFRVLSAFLALPDETDLQPVIRALPDRTWLLPRVAGDQLTLHLPPPNPTFIRGPLGLREPAPDWPTLPTTAVDLFLCPGLAFDPQGHRLGRGRGYYDRLLATARPNAVFAGITRSERIVTQVPTAPHDIPVHWLVTEAGIHPCRPPAAPA